MVLITANDIFFFRDISVEPKNTAISPNFLVWEFCGKAQFRHSFVQFARKLCRNCAFPQNCDTMKLGKITVYFAVPLAKVLSKNFEPIKS